MDPSRFNLTPLPPTNWSPSSSELGPDLAERIRQAHDPSRQTDWESINRRFKEIEEAEKQKAESSGKDEDADGICQACLDELEVTITRHTKVIYSLVISLPSIAAVT